MADIAFLLIIFYMSTTIFRMEDGLPMRLPAAESGQRVPAERLLHVWVDARGRISIGDREIALEDVSSVVSRRLREEPALTVAVNADASVPYRTVAAVLEELQEAGALSVSFTSEPEIGRDRGGE
jgi:biopolymer transport protein ExbD